MNWLVKISGSIEEYLTSLGATPDIVQFIMSVPDGQQFLTNEFRKNPTLTSAYNPNPRAIAPPTKPLPIIEIDHLLIC